MPWKDVSLVSQRYEFVLLAKQDGVNVRALCKGFGVSPKTGYKWLGRYKAEQGIGLEDRSRKPHNFPAKTIAEVEARILAVRDEHPAWGGRKLRAFLADMGFSPPAASTITEILRRNGRLNPEEKSKHTPWHRFEREMPNDLWQMDFKGWFELTRGGRCHPLTIIDDHSRYAVCLKACPNERRPVVQEALIETFRTYGLPERMLMDNGSCWGSHNEGGFYTTLTAWLIRTGISVSHGRIYHPQTQGKNERFNRTVKTEVIGNQAFRDIAHCQENFDQWRPVYNLKRPHDALDLKPPISRYNPSSRRYPETTLPIEYSPGDIIRTVNTNSAICFKSIRLRVGKAFIGQPVALRRSDEDGIYDVFYCHQQIAQIDLKNGKSIYPFPASQPPPGGRL